VRRPYRKRGELGMEEENVLRSQLTELTVAWLDVGPVSRQILTRAPDTSSTVFRA